MRPEVRDKICAQLSVPGVRPSSPRAIELPSSACSKQIVRREDAKNGGRIGLLRLDVAQRLERLTWNNEQLRGDLERERKEHRDSIHARAYIVAEAEHAVQVLQRSLQTYKKLVEEIESESHSK
jgi:hypothetical protein